MTKLPAVSGYCPMGCGQTLARHESAAIICTSSRCPDPTAVHTMLDDRETEHIVKFDDDTFVIRHPLRERINDELMGCDFHDWCTSLSGAPVEPGRYRALRDGTDWRFEPARGGDA